jgi:four helix bundle protein
MRVELALFPRPESVAAVDAPRRRSLPSDTKLPADERFGLTAQIRRASVSVPSNIGEGRRRKSQRAFVYHLDVALGSQGEVEVQLEIARRIGLLAEEDYQSLRKHAEEVGKMLNGLIASLECDAR